MMVILIMPIVCAENKFTEDYNQQVIQKYIESEPVYGYNLFFFEMKFGSVAALIYMGSLILLAVVLGAIITKK